MSSSLMQCLKTHLSNLMISDNVMLPKRVHRSDGGCSRKLTARCFVHDPYRATVLTEVPLIAAALPKEGDAAMDFKRMSNMSFSSATSSVCASDNGFGLSVTSPGEASMTSMDVVSRNYKRPLALSPIPVPLLVVPPPRSCGRTAAASVFQVRINKYQAVEATSSVHGRQSDALVEGAAVILSGDRGEELGFISKVVASSSHDTTTKLACILRTPTPYELEQYHNLRDVEEPSALNALRNIAKEVRFEGIVENAFYQWDGKKLTIFIARTHPRQFLDFRKLQRAAFQQFQCRIWMVYVDEL